MKLDRRGYTLVEVMCAVMIMIIGATGVLAMQGATVRANQDASETSIAVNFATTWMERVKRDARLWNTNGSADLAFTTYLKMVTTNANTWFLPRSTVSESAAADYFGFDTLADPRFCVNLRLNVVHAYDPLTGGTVATTDATALRADLRIWWYRASVDVNRTLLACAPPNDNAVAPALPNDLSIRRQYLSTVVGWRAPGWP